jgi:capsule polysaccharide export protein KpsE/RkpR
MVEATATLQGELIVAQSELTELQQIYTAENVRVRALKAHVAELQDQINKFGGKDYKGATVLDPNSLYPPLKQLPILGRRYAELYQRAKIDEKVFELLTEAYELAKVQEAKETPSIKVLDEAQVPEKPSSPHILLLALMGGAMGFTLVCCWVVALSRWSEMDPDEPYKAFLCQDVLPVVRPRLASARYHWQRISARIRRRSESRTDTEGV